MRQPLRCRTHQASETAGLEPGNESGALARAVASQEARPTSHGPVFGRNFGYFASMTRPVPGSGVETLLRWTRATTASAAR